MGASSRDGAFFVPGILLAPGDLFLTSRVPGCDFPGGKFPGREELTGKLLSNWYS